LAWSQRASEGEGEGKSERTGDELPLERDGYKRGKKRETGVSDDADTTPSGRLHDRRRGGSWGEEERRERKKGEGDSAWR
jgi:hypothetical protein